MQWYRMSDYLNIEERFFIFNLILNDKCLHMVKESFPN